MNKMNSFVDVQNMRRQQILKMFGVAPQQSQSISKAQEVDEDYIVEKGEDGTFEVYDNTIEKSDILHAISNCDNPIKMRKSGKDIKTQISDVILPKKNAELASKKVEADNLLKDCGDAPTCEIDPWWTANIKVDDIPFKIYRWDETWIPAQPTNSISSTLSVYDADGEIKKPKINSPKTPAEAEQRQKYNEAVRIYCEISTDIKACEILTKNLKDNDSIELTARQILAFGFSE